MEIYVNKDGLTVGKLKKLISNYEDNVEVKVTQHNDGELYESEIIEIIKETPNKITLISELTRDKLDE